MIAAQLSLALVAIEGHQRVADRRQLIIAGRPEAIDLLMGDAGDLWKPLPPCFEPRPLAGHAVGVRIVGSFDGVPVAVDPSGPAGWGVFSIDGGFLGGAYYPTNGGPPTSYTANRAGFHPQAVPDALGPAPKNR